MAVLLNEKNREKQNLKSTTAELFANLHYKLNSNVDNQTQILLGTDLLKDTIKKELLVISTTSLEKGFLKFLQRYSIYELNGPKGNLLFLSIIQQTLEDFLTNHYGCKISLSITFIKQSAYVRGLLEDVDILFTIPLMSLIDIKAPAFRLVFSPVYYSASSKFLEALFDNLIVEISNCIVYLLIVDLSAVYVLRQTLYQSNFLSLRNLERFKNNFSWQTRLKTFIRRPLDLYNNRYRIYAIRNNGICSRIIYANRSKEISYLRELPLITISAIELRDFVLSRFDELFYSIGNGVRYTLTSVLGRIIGLIWRGVIDGLKK